VYGVVCVRAIETGQSAYVRWLFSVVVTISVYEAVLIIDTWPLRPIGIFFGNEASRNWSHEFGLYHWAIFFVAAYHQNMQTDRSIHRCDELDLVGCGFTCP